MRTTLILPENLIVAAREATGLKSKTDIVVYALKEVIRRKRLEDLKSMFGKIDINVDLAKTRGRRNA